MLVSLLKKPKTLFMFSCVFNSSFLVFSKLLGESFSPYELAFYRVLIIFTMSLTALVVTKKKFPPFKRFHLLFLLKSILALLSMVSWFITINKLPVSEVVAVSFSTPILTSILAVIMLKEKFTRHHLVAMLAGLVGMVIIVSPERGILNIYALLGIASCLLLSASFVVTKYLLMRDYIPIEINYYGNMTMLPMALLLAYNNLSNDFCLHNIALVLGLGICIFFADFLQNTAYKKSDITTLAPLLFSTIIMGAMLDYFVFDIIADQNIFLGAMFVTSGIIYMNIKVKHNHEK